jgi:CBS domain-containing protein
MSRDVRVTGPQDTIRDAAKIMAEFDIGALPVADQDRLIGMITDRDIVVRGVAQGCGVDATVADVMSPEVLYCFEDEELEDVSQNMGDVQVRRLPVINREKRLVGIISLGDLARSENPTKVGETVSQVSEPGGLHSQTAH